MTERDITGDVDESADSAISGMDRTVEGDFTGEHPQSGSHEGGDALQQGEDWAQDRTQESFEEGDIASSGDSPLDEAGNA